jgi:import inner membrane translocase subunit TIM23
VGVSYISAGTVGFFKGLIDGRPKNWNLPRKLIVNNFFNKCGKETFRFGNAAAAAGLLYYMSG